MNKSESLPSHRVHPKRPTFGRPGLGRHILLTNKGLDFIDMVKSPTFIDDTKTDKTLYQSKQFINSGSQNEKLLIDLANGNLKKKGHSVSHTVGCKHNTSGIPNPQDLQKNAKLGGVWSPKMSGTSSIAGPTVGVPAPGLLTGDPFDKNKKLEFIGRKLSLSKGQIEDVSVPGYNPDFTLGVKRLPAKSAQLVIAQVEIDEGKFLAVKSFIRWVQPFYVPQQFRGRCDEWHKTNTFRGLGLGCQWEYGFAAGSLG
jgi:hypothetical protein